MTEQQPNNHVQETKKSDTVCNDVHRPAGCIDPIVFHNYVGCPHPAATWLFGSHWGDLAGDEGDPKKKNLP